MADEALLLAGMSAGVQDFVTINLSTLASSFGADEVVTIGALQEKRILNLSGREAKLPLKVCVQGLGSYIRRYDYMMQDFLHTGGRMRT